MSSNTEHESGRITKSTGSWYIVALDNGETLSCRLPGKLRLEELDQTNPVAVGDRVHVQIQTDKSGIISEILPRINMITRLATHGRRGQQIMAANIDLGILVQSVKRPQFKSGLIDRFLITCEANLVEPLIVINKMDLAKESDQMEVDNLVQMYHSLGYKVIPISTFSEELMQPFKESIQGKTVSVMGPSGTGKTSILNALKPGLNLTTGAISDFSNKGKHTTTFSELKEIQPGTYIVDTPGIREFGLVDIDPNDLSNFYIEMKDLRMQCKYYNCTHIHEPDCAVMQAYEQGSIQPSRYLSYLQIFESINK
jgi:ribosome biogenesis GTPase / thiamine phosphate phosphatase